MRRAFLDRAALDPRRYLVVDAARSPAQVLLEVDRRVRRMLPLSPRQRREMAARLEADARRREHREARAVEEATEEEAGRAVVRQRVAEDRRRQELHERDRVASEAERMRARAAEHRRRLRESDTDVLPAVHAGGREQQASWYEPASDETRPLVVELPDDTDAERRGTGR